MLIPLASTNRLKTNHKLVCAWAVGEAVLFTYEDQSSGWGPGPEVRRKIEVGRNCTNPD